MDAGRKIAVSALVKVDRDKGYSNIVFNQVIRDNRPNRRDAAFAAALFYGVLEREITLDYIIGCYSKIKPEKMEYAVRAILHCAVYQMLYMDKVPDSAAVNEAVELSRLFGVHRASGLINAVLRAFLRDEKQIKYPVDPLKKVSIIYSCPEWMITMWEKAYGKENTVRFLQSLTGRPPITVRVNTQKTDTETLIQFLEKENVRAIRVSWLENALELEETGAIEELAAYQKGLFHVQDTASQLCCSLLNPLPGEIIYDVCSAPGGKAFTLAQEAGKMAKVLAFDLHEHKVRLIQNGAQRLALENICAEVRDASIPCRDAEKNQADRLLCDVPCSGLGIMRRKPEIRNKQQKELAGLPALQYEILCRSAGLVKPGGILFYSTCTLVPAENRGVTGKFLREHGEDFAPFRLNLPENARIIEENDYEVTLFPEALNTDGFYIAGFRKKKVQN